VRLFTRNGNEWTERYPQVVDAIGALKVKSCVIDGEITVCRPNGVTSFELLRSGRKIKPEAVLHVFDLIELDGDDLRREPIEIRKKRLLCACLMGLDGIGSKRLGSPYQSGQSRHWLKSKNPASEAVRREAEED